MRAFLLAGVVVLGWAGATSAAPIIGQISFAGSVEPVGGPGVGTATGLDFISGPTGTASPGTPGGITSYGAGEGSFTGLTCGNLNGGCGEIQDILKFSTATASSNFVNLTTGTATNISFDFGAITNSTQSPDPNGGSLVLVISGELHFTGLDDTPGFLALTAEGNGITSYTATFLAETTTPVPEPTTFALLGLGVAGVIAARRRRAS